MLNFGFLSHKQKLSRSGFHVTLRYGATGRENVRFVLLQNELNRALSLTWPASMQIYWNKRKRLHKKKEFNVHRIGLGHQYGHRDVMWKHSIAMLRVLPPTNQICLATNQFVEGCGKLLPKVESCSTFCKKICTTCARFTGPRQTCFAASDVTSTYSATPA